MSRFLLSRSQSPTPSVLTSSPPEWTDDRDHCLSALAAIRKFEVRPVTVQMPHVLIHQVDFVSVVSFSFYFSFKQIEPRRNWRDNTLWCCISRKVVECLFSCR